MKFKKFFYKKIGSTNNVAIKKISSGFTNGIIVAEYQNRGRGNFGKKWISFNGNLFMSIFFQLKKNITVKKLTQINCEVLKKTLNKCFKKRISIKYPNDLLINKKKFCGILQEIKFNNQIKYVIIGIGINLVKNPKIKKYPTTNILAETGTKYKKIELIKNIEKNYINKFKLFA